MKAGRRRGIVVAWLALSLASPALAEDEGADHPHASEFAVLSAGLELFWGGDSPSTGGLRPLVDLRIGRLFLSGRALVPFADTQGELIHPTTDGFMQVEGTAFVALKVLRCYIARTTGMSSTPSSHPGYHYVHTYSERQGAVCAFGPEVGWMFAQAPIDRDPVPTVMQVRQLLVGVRMQARRSLRMHLQIQRVLDMRGDGLTPQRLGHRWGGRLRAENRVPLTRHLDGSMGLELGWEPPGAPRAFLSFGAATDLF